MVEARNTDTGGLYPTQSTNTGNYTLSELPAGPYEISVTVPGFKKYRPARPDNPGGCEFARSTSSWKWEIRHQSVTVTEAAALLQTESGELSHNVTTQRLDDLPVLQTGAGAGSSAIRNPTAVVQLVPGAYLDPNVNLRSMDLLRTPLRFASTDRMRTTDMSPADRRRTRSAWTRFRKSRSRPATSPRSTDRWAEDFSITR